MARKQYDQKQYVLAAHQLSDIISQHSWSKEIYRAYYLRGLCYRQMGTDKDKQARSDFEIALKKTRDKQLRQLCHIALGHMFFESASPVNNSAAMEHYLAALKNMTDKPPKDAVLYRLAVTLQRSGQWKKADAYLSRCFSQFEQSSFAQYARGRFGSSAFQLQIAAFDHLDRATEMVNQLKQAGWVGHWDVIQPKGKLLYAVRTGRFNTYADAEKVWQDLIKTYPDAIIVPTI